jgi:histidinol dehydrogenase
MICSFIAANTPEDASSFLLSLQSRFNPEQDESGRQTEQAVRDILQKVREHGLSAVLDYTRKFDAPGFTEDQFRVSAEECERAAAAMDAEDRATLLAAAENIREFHLHQKQRSWFTTRKDGSVLGQMVTPIDRVGLYIPGGQAGLTPLISSLLMNVIPAQVAGVPEIALVSPPTGKGTVSPFILGAAHLLGVSEVYAAGSAWAIAALAHGAGPLRPVDMIAGPGNIFVATAKRLLIGTVGIDMIAGPSEILVIADDSANPAWVAADMLSQAEHDALASSVCITTSRRVAEETAHELERQLETLPRKDIARGALAEFGAIVHMPDLAGAVRLSNEIAPEHLELHLEDPWSALPLIRNAGAVFVGPYASEPVGDYFAGPNHVLPTMRTARFASALGVDSFIKKTSVVATSRAFAEANGRAIARMARMEALEAHARAALCRTTDEK